MIVNEYRLDLTSEKSHQMLKEQCEEFLFGEQEQAPPPEFVPES
jgi:Fe-S cluster biosynthesis and repair protein YggX